ncbi:MAG: zinc-binding dehydrogenase, partial [Terriglobales bacterium]
PGLTALQIVRAAGVGEGKKVLIHGAAGSVGALVVQLALHKGAHVTATALGRDMDYLSQLGVQSAIDNQAERFESAVGPVDVIIDLVGGGLQRRSYAVLRRGGVLASSVGIEDAGAAESHGVRTVAFFMQRNAADLVEVAHMVATGALKLRIARVLPFAEARQAQDLSQHGHAAGKILLQVA